MGARVQGMNVVTRYVADVAERAVKTAAQAEVIYLGLDVGSKAVTSGFWGIDWHLALGYAIGGALASVVTSLASQPVGDPFSASVLPTVGTTKAE